EDGIRDFHVTGVQTCALPILRIGNAAAGQLQLDIYGALIDSIYLYNKWGDPIASDRWDELCTLVDWVCLHWDQPDEGIWETRGRSEERRVGKEGRPQCPPSQV